MPSEDDASSVVASDFCSLYVVDFDSDAPMVVDMVDVTVIGIGDTELNQFTFLTSFAKINENGHSHSNVDDTLGQ